MFAAAPGDTGCAHAVGLSACVCTMVGVHQGSGVLLERETTAQLQVCLCVMPMVPPALSSVRGQARPALGAGDMCWPDVVPPHPQGATVLCREAICARYWGQNIGHRLERKYVVGGPGS